MNEIEKTPHLVIPEGKVPVAAYQAIYHKLTKKTERLSKIYSGAFDFTFDELRSLNQRIEQTIVQYQVKGYNCEVTHSLKNDQSSSFSSFEKFSRANFDHILSPSRSVTLECDFMVVLPTELEETSAIAQRYRVRVTCDQDFVSEEDLDQEEYFFSTGEYTKNIMTNIEYTDFSVARSLQTMLDDWVTSIKNKDERKTYHRFSRFLNTYRARLPSLLAASVLLGSYLFISTRNIDGISPLLLSLTIALTLYAISDIMLKKAGHLVMLVRPSSFLLVTKGDHSRFDERTGKMAKQKALLWFLVGTVLTSFAVSLASSYIWSLITA